MIYLDNAATTYPKPKSVINATVNALQKYSFNSGRSGYAQSINAGEAIFSVREKIGNFFGFAPQNVIFTKNCTEGLNIAINGVVKKDSHIVISDLEHNSVSRVVNNLKEKGIADFDLAKFSYDDDETVENFKRAIKHNTSLVICMHSSNAFGVTFPIAKIGKMCRENGVLFLVDGAQGAGVADINANRDYIDILCAPGHKCLFGAMGSGFLAFRDGVNIESFMVGGTGSSSLSLEQPDFSPDKFEAGTLNNPAIISMGAGIDYINRVGRNKIYNHEMKLASFLFDELLKINDVKLYTNRPEINRFMPIISFNLKDYSSEKVASYLANVGICTRAGFHCSPLAHKHFNTIDRGVVRLSLGAFNNQKECITFVDVVKKI